MQAIFSVYYGTLNSAAYKTLYKLAQFHFYQKVFSMIIVPVPKFLKHKVTRAYTSA